MNWIVDFGSGRNALSKNKLHTPLDHEIKLNRTVDGKYHHRNNKTLLYLL